MIAGVYSESKIPFKSRLAVKLNTPATFLAKEIWRAGQKPE